MPLPAVVGGAIARKAVKEGGKRLLKKHAKKKAPKPKKDPKVVRAERLRKQNLEFTPKEQVVQSTAVAAAMGYGIQKDAKAKKKQQKKAPPKRRNRK